MESYMEADIAALALNCQGSFSTLLAAANSEDCCAPDLINNRDIHDMQDRFDQWAGNLGALQRRASLLSLEYRLRDAPSIKNSICKTITDLCISIQTATEIVSGKRLNRTTDLASDETDISQYNISSSESDSLSSTSSSGERNSLVPTTELQELLSAIATGLESLFKTSMFIRRFASRDRRQRATQTKPFDHRADIMYVDDRYPLLKQKNPALAARLGECNARRRQYFKYRRDHNERISTVPAEDEFDALLKKQIGHKPGYGQPAQSAQTVESKSSTLAETKATTFVADDEAVRAYALDIQEAPAAMSVVSFATSVAEASDEELPFPKIPSEAQSGLSFICPYCQNALRLNRQGLEHQWRKHVLLDLEPYVCTYPMCNLDTYQSQHAWFEHELVIHRSQWVCTLCSTSFRSSNDLEAHIVRMHRGIITDRQLPTIIDHSRRTIEHIQPSECPFCESSWADTDSSDLSTSNILVVDLDQFRRHLGHHLQQVALFALPRLLEDDERSLGSQDVGARLDEEVVSMDNRRLKDSYGRGWSIISRKYALLRTLAAFLALYHDYHVVDSTLLDWDITQLDASHLKEGGDWHAVFNPDVQRILDIDLMHSLEHDSVVCTVKFSPDGNYLATGCNQQAKVFEVATGIQITELQHESAIELAEDGNMLVRCVCFSPDGMCLVTGAEDKLIRLWDIQSSTIRSTFSGHEEGIFSLDFASNGSYIASGSSDHTVRIWNLEHGTALLTLVAEASVTAVAISPNSVYVAAGSLDCSILIWDTRTGATIDRLLGFEEEQGTEEDRILDHCGHTGGVYSLIFAEEMGTTLYSGSLDMTIKYWALRKDPNATTPDQLIKGGKRLNTLDGHKDYVTCLAMTPDHKWLISGSKDQSVHFWDELNDNETQVMIRGHKQTVMSVAASPQGEFFATGSSDRRARIWRYSEFAKRYRESDQHIEDVRQHRSIHIKD